MDKVMEASFLNNQSLGVQSELINIEHIFKNNYAYSIPLYQRLYVWKDDQVLTLLEDLKRASDNDEPNYFLGGIMIAKNAKINCFDLIDGQQRFTTLWLISKELQRQLSGFTYYKDGKQQKPRIVFLIREFANKYFNKPDDYKNFNDDEKSQLENIRKARKQIVEFFKDFKEEEKEKYAAYIYQNLKFTQTEMPANIDENRLFEVLNNRGEQLQHHQILKNRLLSKIESSEKEKYAQLWDACAIMDNYIEKNIKDVGDFKWSELTFNSETEEKEVELPANILERLKSHNYANDPIHLIDIVNPEFSLKAEENAVENGVFYDSGKVRSIVSFPMLLLHTLRIFLYEHEKGSSENDVEINEKKLLQLFEKSFQGRYHNTENYKQFIELLWQVRVKFDKFVIKWVEVDVNEEHHQIKKLYLNKSAIQRRATSQTKGFELLQSMLYHSQQIITHYWLTPFLYKMLSTDSFEALYSYLKKLDNAMFCGQLTEGLKERSHKYIYNDFKDFSLNISDLSNHLGTAYRSYWFYKMDFILWHEKHNEVPQWKDFRMTKKNSVEHISPQQPKAYDENKLWDDNENLTEQEEKTRLDDFGNLVLLSVGMNSEYSNKTFLEKQTTFKEKKRLESLKSDIIFSNTIWNNEQSLKHRKSMTTLFVQYVEKSMD